MTEPPDGSFNAEFRTEEEVKQGAVRGGMLLFGRSIGVLLVTAVATIALARILTPADYGAFAVAVAVQLLGRAAVELGMPVALVRRDQPPSLEEQRAVTGFMLLFGLTLAGLVSLTAFVIAPLLGENGDTLPVVAVACLALPIYGIRAVPVVLCERGLHFGRLALFEVSESMAFYGFAVATAVAGLGAFSLAAAVPVGGLAGAVTAYALQPWHFGLSLRRDVIRPLVRFGAQTSLIGPAHFSRELGVVSMLTAVGGQSLAGFYAMAQRLFIIPTLINSVVWRVSVAALSRTVHAERDRLSAGGIGITTVAAGLALALVAGAAEPLISLLFGDRWLSSADVVAAGAPGLLLMNAAALLGGAALADGNARSPLMAAIAGGAVAVGLTLPLADSLGAEGGGIASSAGFAVAALILTVGAQRPQRAAMALALKALVAMAIGALAGRAAGGGTGLEDLVIALACSGGAWLAATAILSRNELAELIRLMRRHAFRGEARGRPAEEPLAEAIAEAESAGF